MYTTIKAYSKESLKAFHDVVKGPKVNADKDNYIIDKVIYKGVEITFYTTGSVLFKGDINSIKDDVSLLVDKTLYVGIDEVGVGENIGPYASCIVRFNDYESKMNVALHGIKDSKKMSHFEIVEAAKVIKDNAKVECIVMEPKKFNVNYKKIKNMKALNAIAQNKLNLAFKDYDNHVTDQFVSKEKYVEYLTDFNQEVYDDIFFTTKAEDKYMEVAAAAIVAKNEFNSWMIKYLDKHNINYEIKNKLSTNDIWTKIKNGDIEITDRDSLIKDWSK